MTVNFNDDLPRIRDFIGSRVLAQASDRTPISAIEFSFRLSQLCLLFLHFDTRERHDRNGEQWSGAFADEPTLEMPHWHEAFQAADGEGISFLLPSGETRSLPPGAADEEAVAAAFGDALRAIALEAAADGAFAPLPLRADCQLDMEEFDGMWAWPDAYEDVGRTNLLRELVPGKEG
jgi:hypothetical protein